MDVSLGAFVIPTSHSRNDSTQFTLHTMPFMFLITWQTARAKVGGPSCNNPFDCLGPCDGTNGHCTFGCRPGKTGASCQRGESDNKIDRYCSTVPISWSLPDILAAIIDPNIYSRVLRVLVVLLLCNGQLPPYPSGNLSGTGVIVWLTRWHTIALRIIKQSL